MVPLVRLAAPRGHALRLRDPHQRLRPARQLLALRRPRAARPHAPLPPRRAAGPPRVRHLGLRQAAAPVHLLGGPRQAVRVGAGPLRRAGAHHPVGARGGRAVHRGRGQAARGVLRVRGEAGLRHQQGRRAVQEDGGRGEAARAVSRIRVHPVPRSIATIRGLVESKF